ncbi:hypothetical protein SAMN05444680_104351 [Variovorax sp. YR216]|nr:hypothetical protein SAMN05444680_104351 [Variovorax sp. YR216]
MQILWSYVAFGVLTLMAALTVAGGAPAALTSASAAVGID